MEKKQKERLEEDRGREEEGLDKKTQLLPLYVISISAIFIKSLTY
jgi:hypothetical protein